MELFFRLFVHLLPTGRAWRITIQKTLRAFFEALATALGAPVKTEADLTFLDNFPQTTRNLAEYEAQFGLEAGNLTEQQRRDRLAAVWRATGGGQSPRYLQDVLQSAGFDVYVHEFWVPSSRPAVGVDSVATVRNPLTYLRASYLGADEVGKGYPLVNKLSNFTRVYLGQCGNANAQCGNAAIQCGNSSGTTEVFRDYTIPNDATVWPFFMYVGGETFGDLASVEMSRRDEFEELCLRICPEHLWLGILVQYS